MIVVNRAYSTTSPYGIPGMPEIPRIVYSSYLDAKQAIAEIVEKFQKFTPVAYGSAYPYENTSFEKEIVKNGYATVGWIVKNEEVNEDDDGSEDESYHVPIGILRIPLYS